MTQSPSQALSFQELTRFFNERHPQLQNYLYRQLKSRETAEDLAQETYVRFLRQTQTQAIADLNAFLFTIAANLARDHARKLKRQACQQFVELDEDIPDDKPDAEELVAASHLEMRLQQVLTSLPERTREVFLLYRADGLRYKDIAEQLAISERTVEYHIRQAMLHCRRCLTSE